MNDSILLPNSKEALKKAADEWASQLTMWTFHGSYYYPFNPEASAGIINIQDIAHALAHQCRFGGHCDPIYTVGMHSIMIKRMAEHRGEDRNTQLYCLLHDASEAYLTDLPTPIKIMLPDYEAVENRWHDVLLAYYKVDRNDHATKVMKTLDHEICVLEAELLQPATMWWRNYNILEIDREGFEQNVDIISMSPSQIGQLFIEEYYSLLEDK